MLTRMEQRPHGRGSSTVRGPGLPGRGWSRLAHLAQHRGKPARLRGVVVTRRSRVAPVAREAVPLRSVLGHFLLYLSPRPACSGASLCPEREQTRPSPVRPSLSALPPCAPLPAPYSPAAPGPQREVHGRARHLLPAFPAPALGLPAGPSSGSPPAPQLLGRGCTRDHGCLSPSPRGPVHKSGVRRGLGAVLSSRGCEGAGGALLSVCGRLPALAAPSA